MNITDTCILVPVTNMEKILESLVNVDPETSSPNVNEIPRSTNNPPHNQTEMAAATQISKVEGTSLSEDKTASSSVEEEIDDVMNVLKDLNDVASLAGVSETYPSPNFPATPSRFEHETPISERGSGAWDQP